MNMLYIIPLFIGGLRGWQLIIVVLLVLLLFGGKKIPELMKGLGKGVHAFKQGLEEAKHEINKPVTPVSDKEEEKKSEPVQAKDKDE